MEFIILACILTIITILVGIIFKYNKKQIEDIAKNEDLDKIAEKYPSNVEICKEYLEILKNEEVVIEEDKNANSCLYIVATNKILIANMRNSFTRIQTIAHECLHSIQDKRLLLFNFIFSNIYNIYFVVISILAIFGVLPSKMIFLTILLIFSMVYILVRNYLENDAMIKARFLAKEYMNNKKISDEAEIEKMITQYDQLNNMGIKLVNFSMFFSCAWKILVFCIICIK